MASAHIQPQNPDATLEAIKARQQQRFSPLGLPRNPFPLGGNFPQAYLEYTQLSPNHRDQIDDFILSTFDRGEFNGMLILGEYGSGKSHLLYFIQELVNSDLLHILGGCALAFVIENPSVAPEDILLSLLRKIKLGTVQDLIFHPIRRRLAATYGDDLLTFLERFTTFTRQTKLTPGALAHQQYQAPWYSSLFSGGYAEFRETLSKQNLALKPAEFRDFARDVLHEEVTDNSLIAGSLLALVFGEDRTDASSWESLLLNTLSGRRGQAIGVEFYLGAVLKLFTIMGIHHVYLLVDELEDLRTQRLTKRAATEYLATLRRMIQHNYQMFSFVLASTRDAWDELRLYYPAIEDRFPIVIDLARDRLEIKEIVAGYLRRARGEPTQEPLEEQDRWSPFAESAVDSIIAKRGIVLRHVLTECRRLLDIAAEEAVTPPLGPDFVDSHVTTPILPPTP